MSLHSWMLILAATCSMVGVAWILSALVLSDLRRHGELDPKKRGVRVARWIFHEVKPFFQAIAVIKCAAYCIPITPWDVLNVIILIQDFWLFHLYKDADDDDDRWKRRKQKVLGKIEVVNGKLAVNPA